MNLSLDFDDTFTLDQDAWIRVIHIFRDRGHKVYVVTMREDWPPEADEVRFYLQDHVDGIYFTNRKAKKKFMADQGFESTSGWMTIHAGF